MKFPRRNGNETDIDCGGGTCTGCALTQSCILHSDCLSNFCDNLVCATPLFLTKTITINSTDPAVLTDFQVLVELNPSNFTYGDVQADGRDIRFSSDGTQHDIPYWRRTWNTTGTSQFWVKVPSIPGSGSVDIYLLYGESTWTDNSDGDSTFEFFDDFEDGVYTDKWNAHGSPGTLVEAAGQLHFQGNSNWEYIGSNVTFNIPVTIHSQVLINGVSAATCVSEANSDRRFTFQANGAITATTFDDDVFSSNTFEDQNYPGVPFTQGSWHEIIASFRLNGSSIELIEYCNGSNCQSTPRNFTRFTGINAFVAGYTSYSTAFEIYVEETFVRKYTSYNVTAVVN